MRRNQERHLILDIYTPPMWTKGIIPNVFVRCTCDQVFTADDWDDAIDAHKAHGGEDRFFRQER